MGRLEGKVAIITGATSGIGRRTAERFVEEGASVVIAARREDEGERLARSLGVRVSFIRTDVTQEDDVRAMIAHGLNRYGRLDCLFNNAGGGIGAGGDIEAVRLDEFEAMLARNFRSVFLGIKHAAAAMKRQGSGSIISTGSTSGIQGGRSYSMIYSASKAAVIHLSRCAAMELGEYGVRVNTISPGGIATGVFGKIMGLPPEEAERTTEAVKGALARMQPIPRAGLPDDIAGGAVFLASDESSFINGHDLVIDGGLIAGRPWSLQQESWKKMQALLRGAVE